MKAAFLTLLTVLSAATVDPRVEAAHKEIEAFNYEAAIVMLLDAAADEQLDPQVRAGLYSEIGALEVDLLKNDAARRSFTAALRLHPGVTPPASSSNAARALLEGVRRSLGEAAPDVPAPAPPKPPPAEAAPKDAAPDTEEQGAGAKAPETPSPTPPPEVTSPAETGAAKQPQSEAPRGEGDETGGLTYAGEAALIVGAMSGVVMLGFGGAYAIAAGLAWGIAEAYTQGAAPAETVKSAQQPLLIVQGVGLFGSATAATLAVLALGIGGALVLPAVLE